MEIPLTQGLSATIDEADWPMVAPYKWRAKRDQDGRWYASTDVWCPVKRKRITLGMHSLISGAKPGEMADHVNPAATLDNRRQNLRACTNALNQQNAGPRGGASRYKGVSWNAQKGR